jgi:hypothetical protein
LEAQATSSTLSAFVSADNEDLLILEITKEASGYQLLSAFVSAGKTAAGRREKRDTGGNAKPIYPHAHKCKEKRKNFQIAINVKPNCQTVG